jgi:hypothetical protein
MFTEFPGDRARQSRSTPPILQAVSGKLLALEDLSHDVRRMSLLYSAFSYTHYTFSIKNVKLTW